HRATGTKARAPSSGGAWEPGRRAVPDRRRGCSSQPGHRGKAQEDVSLEERVLIPGTGPLTRKLVEEVQARPGARYAVVGLAEAGWGPEEPPFLTPLRHAGKVIEEIAQRVERLAQGELDPGVELTRGDDMGIPAEQVNRLGEQIYAERRAG